MDGALAAATSLRRCWLRAGFPAGQPAVKAEGADRRFRDSTAEREVRLSAFTAERRPGTPGAGGSGRPGWRLRGRAYPDHGRIGDEGGMGSERGPRAAELDARSDREAIDVDDEGARVNSVG